MSTEISYAMKSDYIIYCIVKYFNLVYCLTKSVDVGFYIRENVSMKSANGGVSRVSVLTFITSDNSVVKTDLQLQVNDARIIL